MKRSHSTKATAAPKKRRRRKNSEPWLPFVGESLRRIDLDAAFAHLASDERLRPSLASFVSSPAALLDGLPKSLFRGLCEKIIETRVTVKAAAGAKARLWKRAGADDAAAAAWLRDEALERLNTKSADGGLGVGNQKATFLKSLGTAFADTGPPGGALVAESLQTLKDADLVRHRGLNALKGVGPATLQTMLIRVFRRADVLVADDNLVLKFLGLLDDFKSDPAAARAKVAAETKAWSPHRSVANLLIWHSYDNFNKN